MKKSVLISIISISVAVAAETMNDDRGDGEINPDTSVIKSMTAKKPTDTASSTEPRKIQTTTKYTGLRRSPGSERNATIMPKIAEDSELMSDANSIS